MSSVESPDEDGGAVLPVPGGLLMCVGYAPDGDGGCVADARRRAAAFLEEARTEHLVPVPEHAKDLTELVVSELLTNACTYAPGLVLVELCVTADSVDVVVWDSDPAIPLIYSADPDRVGRHGLEIVKAVTENLFVGQDEAGKCVTARIALGAAPGPA
ncbi:ATP-binding protein [Streptomyces sp. NPDC001744]|uniref:ATP-binding protein n=1 Tax=Streptomyces sp. NPDC001744 TaxID=3364606 RepID=UPI0036A55E11